jgi:photoactive yellow protein
VPKRHITLVPPPSELPEPAEPVTPDNCEREPIHIPGAIQPHGALVAFEPGTSIIRHASANLRDWLPVGCLPLKGRALSTLLDRESWTRIEAALRVPGATGVRHEIVVLRPAGADPRSPILEGIVHRHRGQCLLEIERAPSTPIDGMQVHIDVTAALRGAIDLDDLLSRLAQRVRRFTGLDRVMVYRFDSDWHGEVVAEACESDMESFLGLHYPASDIPSQARELYRTNLVRYIADVGYAPVPVLPASDPVSREPLDMSHSVLRSVSPMHVRYLQNMGVQATLTISLVVDGQLWGLVACHHRRPMALSLAVRQTCTALALSASYLIGAYLQKMRYEASSQASQVQSHVVGLFGQAEVPLSDAVEHATASLLQLVGATGGALWHRGDFIPFGRWPRDERGGELRRFAEARLAGSHDELQVFDALPLERPLEPEELKVVCGALVLRLGDFTDSGLMWLRPEFRREVNWGGDPDKPADLALDAQGRPMLTPRASFERWTTLVKGRCRPWTELDLSAALSMLPLRQMLAVRDSLAEARDSDRRFRGLLDLQSDAYWQVDTGGILITLSKPLPLPVDVGAVDGRSLAEVLEPVCTKPSIAALRRALHAGEAFRDLRLTSISQDPALEFELLLSGDPLRDRQQLPVGFHGTLTDVSQALRAGRELRLREAAEMSSRTKSRFLSQVSHELRTPLNAVLGYAQLLLADAQATDAQRAHVQHIEKAGQWLLAMISDLLDVARIEAGRIDLHLQTVAPAPVVEQTLATLRVLAETARVELQLQAPAEPLWTHADATRLGQVLLNLISNAIKYNRPGGKVTVTVAQPSAERVTIAVRDTGQGLDAFQLAHIFEPFNRLGRENQMTPGTGIGLVIARQLAEAMGGRIDVESQPEAGSCFTLSLVAAGSAGSEEAQERLPPEPEEFNRQLRPAAAPAPAPSAHPSPATVLYVEDEPTNAELMRAVVETVGGATMRHAATAEDGLKIAQRELPAVMLIDLNLPGKDGGWLLQQIRSDPDLAHAHCVAVTADAMRETQVRVRGLGFNQCWTKPLDLRWTGRALRAALDSVALGVQRPPLRFDDPAAFQVLASAPTEWLDTLDFGVVRLDAALCTTAYNLRESLLTGYEPEAVIGRPFFKEVGPCMDNPLIAERLAAVRALDVTLEYVFRLRLRREPVRLRLLAEPGMPHRFLLIDRLR